MIRAFGLFSILLSLSLTSLTSFGQSSSSLPKSETRAERSKWRISYFGDAVASTLYGPTSGQKYDENSRESGTVGWLHEPGIDYRIGERTTVKVKASFTTLAAPDENGQNVLTDDLTFGIANSGIIRTENFNLYAGLGFSPAMTEYSRSRNRTGEVGATIIPAYTFGSSGLRLEWVSLLKQYFYQPRNELNDRTVRNLNSGRLSNFKVEFYPGLLYALNDNSSAFLGGHLLYINSRNQGTNFQQLEDTLHIGVHHKFNSALSIRPSLRFRNPTLGQPNENLAKSTEIGMLIFGSIQ